MSLEAKLEALNATIDRLITATEQLIELRANAIETVRTTAAPAAKATTKAAAAKAETPPPAASTETPPPAAAAPAAPAGADESAYDEVKLLVTKFNTGSDRPEEVQARKEKVRWLLRHASLCKPELVGTAEPFSVMDISPENIGKMVKNLNKLIEQGDLTKPATADADLV